MTAAALRQWLDETVLDLGRQFRWSYLPPLMVYLAAGVSGLTAVVGTFFVKDYLGLSAAFLAGLTFWAGIQSRRANPTSCGQAHYASNICHIGLTSSQERLTALLRSATEASP